MFEIELTPQVAFITVALIAFAIACFATRKEVSTQGPPEYPIIRGFFWVVRYGSYSVLDGMLLACSWYNWKTWTIRWPGAPRLTCIVDPKNLEHVLKTRFDNYPKGRWFKSMLSDLLGHGIFAEDGESWNIQRKVSVHMFSAREFKDNIMRVFHEHAIKLRRVLDEAVFSGATIDLHQLFHRYTLDSIAEIAFGVSVGSLDNPYVPFARAFDTAQTAVENRAYLPGWQYLKYVLPREYRLRAALKVLNSYCFDLIEARRGAGEYEERHDVLSRFMCMKDDNGQSMFLHDNEALRDVILNMMIAGRDTTAQALSWATYRVCENPSVAAGIQQELKQVKGSETGDLSYEKIAKEMKYTTAVMNETLRLHPSVPKDIKECLEDDTLPDGTFIPKGSYIAYLQHAMGRNEELWGKTACDFLPERFLSTEKFSAFKFPAFNAGPRTCLGQHMALVESSFVLSLLFSEYNVTLDKNTPVEPLDSLTLPMRHGLKAVITRRK